MTNTTQTSWQTHPLKPVYDQLPSLISTGQLAKLLNTEPRNIADWADQGRILALRTAGGHRRIPKIVALLLITHGHRELPPIHTESVIDCLLADIPDVLTVSQAARVLHVSGSTIARWNTQGLLPALRTKGGHRRFHKNDIVQLLTTPRPR